MKEAEESLVNNGEVKNALDLCDKNRKKKIGKLQRFDSSYVLGKSHFEDDGLKKYLVFQPVCKHLKTPTDNYMVIAWISKGFSGEGIKSMYIYIKFKSISYVIVLIQD